MDKIEKHLRRLSQPERQEIQHILSLLADGKINGLDIKKLKGFTDVYRIRVKRTRIIFQQTDSGIRLIDIAKRDEKTYKNF